MLPTIQTPENIPIAGKMAIKQNFLIKLELIFYIELKK